MFVMLTVPLQGCWELHSWSPADSEVLSSLSLVASASRAERFSPGTDRVISEKTEKHFE